MARLLPLRALHYDLEKVGGLEPVLAPPYDVIDDAGRAALLEQSPKNIVEIDLPVDGAYDQAAATLGQWIDEGTLVRDEEPAVWPVEQVYTGPDGAQRTRKGVLARVVIEPYGEGGVRPHERTHPGPKEDRLRLTRATKANLSPVFALHADPTGAAREVIDAATNEAPFGEATDEHGTLTRVFRLADRGAIQRLQDALDPEELLIADGHHRYETARVYADEIGGEGGHRSLLVLLVALEDPGLTVFPTHRLITGTTSETQEALRAAVHEHFDVVETTREELVPKGGDGPIELGFMDSHRKQPYRLTLKDPASMTAELPDSSEALRSLDTAVVERLLLRGALGMTEDDISHQHGLQYARSDEEALDLVESGQVDLGIFLAPIPVTRIQAIAAAGESMPPKSTFFFPKVPTGIVVNPLDEG